MNDKELLELAAKAAGIELLRSRLDDPMCRDFLLSQKDSDDNAIGWNPLSDDGDALRLAVKLGMIIGTYDNYSTVDMLSPHNKIETITVWHSKTENNREEATRRAIVRAAASIGKDMK